MAGVLYMVYSVLKIYLFNPSIVKAIKIPPILPLFPYLPQVFKLDFLPPFYFTYWIIILAVIAITHEMAHGIFAVYNKVKIKTTGFGFFPWFLPIFLAAFVELDEKRMAKKKTFPQLAILAGGTFANVLTAALFLFVLFGFFSMAFSPAGVIYDNYATSRIPIAGISMFNNISLNNASYEKILNLSKSDGFNYMIFMNQSYLATKKTIEDQKDNPGSILVYNNAPAIRENISSIILNINGVKIDTIKKLQIELRKYKPGDNITITGKTDNGFLDKSVVLDERPGKPGTAWLGIGFFDKTPQGIIGNIVSKFSSFRNPNVYYAPKFNGISVFIYNLLWWIVIISISVALINMLPVGIFDGGRFFYLTVFALTKNEKISKKAFAFTTYLFLFILFLLMVFWFFSFL